MKAIDEIIYEALKADEQLTTATDGRVMSTCIEVPPTDADNTPLPYIIVSFDGLTNDVETKDDPFEGDTDHVSIGIEIAARTRIELGVLADRVRKAVHSYCLQAIENNDTLGEVPEDYTFSAQAVNYDSMKPCYWQILNYQCDCDNNVIADDDDEQE